MLAREIRGIYILETLASLWTWLMFGHDVGEHLAGSISASELWSDLVLWCAPGRDLGAQSAYFHFALSDCTQM